jgi:GTP-binding protein
VSSFVDRAQLHAKAGDGGAGAISFRREAHVDRGGPDGGSGGDGGDVWLVASRNQASLIGFRDHPHRRAGDGGHGASKRKTGGSGADLEVPLPVGTVIVERDGTVLADLAAEGDRWLVARGGRGGRGNSTFLSNRRRAPAFGEQGERGEERWLTLELKLVADVAIVGFPNVGKSTLISAISAAKPKVADYPFTTLVPNLGVVAVPGERSEPDADFVVADIPGLVEGAAEGRGLGHEFLRHVERARVLLILVDLAATGGVDPAAQLRVLVEELGRYQADLLERPRLVVGSKGDLLGDLDSGHPVAVDLVISAASGAGLPALVTRLAALAGAARAEAEAEPARDAIVVHRPAGDEVAAVRLAPGIFELVGRPAERAISLSDLTDDQALDVVLGRLRRLGVDRILARAGVRDGDEVRVGELSFTWYRDGPDRSLETTPPEAVRRRRGAR